MAVVAETALRLPAFITGNKERDKQPKTIGNKFFLTFKFISRLLKKTPGT